MVSVSFYVRRSYERVNFNEWYPVFPDGLLGPLKQKVIIYDQQIFNKLTKIDQNSFMTIRTSLYSLCISFRLIRTNLVYVINGLIK